MGSVHGDCGRERRGPAGRARKGGGGGGKLLWGQFLQNVTDKGRPIVCTRQRRLGLQGILWLSTVAHRNAAHSCRAKRQRSSSLEGRKPKPNVIQDKKRGQGWMKRGGRAKEGR